MLNVLFGGAGAIIFLLLSISSLIDEVEKMKYLELLIPSRLPHDPGINHAGNAGPAFTHSYSVRGNDLTW
ncbi:MAG: hypothetical protein QW772_07090 [Zestosphaera sp.]